MQRKLHQLFGGEDPTQLNYDALQLIFDELEFPNLLDVAELCKDFSFLAARAFERNFGQVKISMGNFAYSKPPNRIDLAIRDASKKINKFVNVIPLNLNKLTVDKDVIRIQSMVFALKTLRHFGKHIQKLEVQLDDITTKAATSILQYIERYCLESMVDFTIDFTKGDALRQFKKPFKRVEKLTFTHRSDRGITKPTNETFPALRELSFESHTPDYNYGYGDGHFPHLKHLSLAQPDEYSKPLETLIEMNSEIDTFTCKDCSEALVHYASTKLSRLNHLILENFYTCSFLQRRDIRFDTVKKATLFKIQGSPRIRLPNLQQFATDSGTWNIETLTQFLEIHRNITTFCMDYSQMEDNDFNMIVQNLPNIEEMTVMRNAFRFIDSDDIIDFLETHRKLMKFQIDDCRNSDIANLREKLNEKWDIENYVHGLSFQRKMLWIRRIDLKKKTKTF